MSKKICFSNLQTYDYLFFTSKIMLKLLDWISFLKMIPHVSFPNKNLKNFSLSISGSKIQAARTTTTNFTRKLATAKEFFTQKSSERCRPNKTASWYYYYLNFTYLGSNLVSALTGLNVNDFSHLE